MKNLLGLGFVICLVVQLVSCTTATTIPQRRDGPPLSVPRGLADLPDPVPRTEPHSKRGNPASYRVLGKTYRVMSSANGYVATGNASWYGRKFHGRLTSSGEPFDMFELTAAHRTLPIPAYVRVTNLANGKNTVVRVNDRGPFHSDRIIDLSYAGAVKLDFHTDGTAPVRVEVLTPEIPQRQLADSDRLQPFKEIVPQPSESQVAEAGPPPQQGYNAVNAVYVEHFVLQAGAFNELGAADNLKSSLITLTGQPTFVVRLADDDLYRVRLGPVVGRGEALRLQALIVAADLGRAMILKH